jgi:ribulose 1,5-bisphosphate synthetase/thiazole synthase
MTEQATAQAIEINPQSDMKASRQLRRRANRTIALRQMKRHKETTMATHDAVIIGTGQAGPSLAGRLAEAGVDVAIIERKFFGGTCVNTGCIPTKTLLRRP